MTIGEALSGKNALNLVRLVLAGVVIVGHSWPLGGFGEHPELGGTPIGEWAVNGFFCVSGYLIAASRMRLTFPRFLWHRFLRIFPGFWVCLVVVAFGFAPAASLLVDGERYSSSSALGYVVNNLALRIRQGGIDWTLGDVPYLPGWNGSLWTLEFEFIAYIAAGVLLTGWLRRHATLLPAVLLVAVIVLGVVIEGHVTTQFYLRGVYLASFFLAGMVLRGLAQRLPATPILAALAVAWLAVVCVLESSPVWAAVPVAYLLLWVGGTVPPQWSPRLDLSYGVYIYAFPVQQSLALAGVTLLGPLGFTLLSIAGTVPLAFVSFVWVERPALRLKDWRRTGRDSRPTKETPSHLAR